MAKRRTILVVITCFLFTTITVRTLSQAAGSNERSDLPDLKRLQKMTEAERQRYIAKRRAQRLKKLERERKESTKTAAQRKKEREQKQKEARERMARRSKELLREKYALGATEEQWKIIKPKLERVRDLREKVNSTVGLLVGSSSISGSGSTNREIVPTMQWNPGWKDKAPTELTEAQKIANRLMAFVDKDETTDEQFKRQMAALRDSRKKQAGLEKELSEARQELRKVLTTREEAALVLIKGWL